jgi:hypothetical protein
MLKRYKGKLVAVLPAASLALVAGSAMASGGIDVSAVDTAIRGALTPIGVLGIATLVVLAGIKTYKWVRRAM